MQSEYRVLCALISYHADDSIDNTLGSSQWESLIELARGEGVAPLLYDRLKNRETGIPEDCLETLKADYYRPGRGAECVVVL